MPQIPFFLLAFTTLAMYVWYNMKKGLNNDSLNKYLDEESKANFARKKEINPSLFVSPDLSLLPFKEDLDKTKYRALLSRQTDVRLKAANKMIRFENPPSNKDLKLAYGLANLENISSWEDNYRKYIISLIKWAETLIEADMLDAAETVLIESIRFGSDFRKSYTLLGDIYKARNDSKSLRLLRDKAFNCDIESKDYICNYISKLLKELEQ